MNKAVVLLSGGLDSTTLLYYAKSKRFQISCLIFDYGQRHRKEIHNAEIIAKQRKVAYKIVQITLPWQGSSLLDKNVNLPQRKIINPKESPSTYVPARNIIFLSFAASYAEAIGANAIFIGANAIDYSGYPDCRSDFMKAFEFALRKGMKTGVQNKPIQIHTPFIHKTKAQIIQLGLKLKVPYGLTWSCYKGVKKPCGVCDSCLLRAKGFEILKQKDPAL